MTAPVYHGAPRGGALVAWRLLAPVVFDDLRVLGPKCHSVECLRPVAACVHWVTGPLDVCAVCAARWRKVAEALGMVVRVDRVEYTPPGLDDLQQRVRLLEVDP